MSRGRRVTFWILLALAGLLVVVAAAGLWIVRSPWFYDQVRRRIVSTIEDASGGRVEIDAFAFDWTHLRAEVRGLTVHGTEPAGKPPLLHANSAAVGLKIISILQRDVNMQYLEVETPRVYLLVNADGSTNIPAPKHKLTNKEDPIETVLKLAIGRLSMRHGEVDVEKHGRMPFDIDGQQVAAQLVYEANGPRYRGELSIEPLHVRWNGHEDTADIHAALTFQKNRVGVDQLTLAMGKSRIQANGAVEDLASPHAAFHYTAHLTAADASHFLAIRGITGEADVRGTAQYSASGYSTEAALHVSGAEYRSGSIALSGFRLSGALRADPATVRVTGAQFAGRINGVFKRGAADFDGAIADMELRGADLNLRDVAVRAFGGAFRGTVRLHDFERYQVKGEIRDFAARRVVALESDQPLPWDAIVEGNLTADGSLAGNGPLQASAELTLTPAPASAPVQGHLAAAYDSRTGIIDLGHSSLRLPSTKADFSGAIGRQLQVHLETRDFNDILPALGESTQSLPIALENGDAKFDGMVTGSLDDLHFQGHAAASRIAYQGRLIDSLEADVTASAENVKAENASVEMGGIRARGEMAVALDHWKTSPASLIYGKGSIRNAAITELAKLAGQTDVPVTGTLAGTAEVTGRIGDPIVVSDLTMSRAVVRGEPVDRAAAHVRYTNARLEAQSGQLTAGGKQAAFSGTFDHAPDVWNTGRLVLQLSTNAMPIDQIHTVDQERPGVKGTVTVTAHGAVDLAPAKSGEQGWRIHDLHLDLAGHGLQLTGQPIGDVHLTADSQGPNLRAHLDSAIAGSQLSGDGEWQLEGEYPGHATVTFSKLDFSDLRQWVAPHSDTAAAFGGSAEGQLIIDGPALEPQLLRTQLRIPRLELLPPPGTAPEAASDALRLHNSGDIVVSLTGSVVTVESAHLVGRATDLVLSGKAQLRQKNELDLQVRGHLDLALVHDLNRDFQASGTVITDATVHGPIDAPEVSGRTEFQNASFNIVDMPNGISKANGVITFAGQQATIQSFTGETGGGSISLSGFAGLNNGKIVFRLAARAQQVRIRYPEGVSTVASANLSLTGTSDRSMLSGTVTIERAGFNPQSDFSSVIAASAEPVETPSVRTGLLGGLNFDIQVNTASDLQFQSSLTQDLEADASLQVHGTFSNPAILGRINITRGQILFFGTKYNVSQGSVAFYNPLRIEPVIEISLETKAQGVDVTLTISGPLHHLNLTPSSDPPLAFNEIVALLATGRAPTSDPALVAQQNSAPQNWQQMGASALLGQAIASPVAGRLQRFFGVSNLRIDPTITGVENNAGARVTLQQQVTPDITFTYITYVTTSNPQVVRVEWSLSRMWSAVAVRDENGIFGVDFYYKKRFR